MLGTMAAIGLVLAFTTGLAAWLARRLGTARTFGHAFMELGYQYAPVAMVSLILGLGAELFRPLAGLDPAFPGLVKGTLFVVGLLWSLWLGDRILRRQGLNPGWRWLPTLPRVLGSVAVGAAWWPGIFGV